MWVAAYPLSTSGEPLLLLGGWSRQLVQRIISTAEGQSSNDRAATEPGRPAPLPTSSRKKSHLVMLSRVNADLRITTASLFCTLRSTKYEYTNSFPGCKERCPGGMMAVESVEPGSCLQLEGAGQGPGSPLCRGRGRGEIVQRGQLPFCSEHDSLWKRT